MSKADDDRITLPMLARGALKALPQAGAVARGSLRLALLKPDSRASIGSLLEQRGRWQPKATALLWGTRRWSYAEFNAEANRCAAVLRASGAGPGAVVAILMENRAEVLICVAAVVKLGAVAAMLNHQQRGAALAHAITITAPAMVIVGAECREAIESTGLRPSPGGPRAQPRTFFWHGERPMPRGYRDLANACRAAAATNPEETRSVRARDAAFYIFTSGTTGLPKASVMTHFRWLRGMAGLGQSAMRLKRDDVLYCPLPLYHNNALTVSWGATLGAGAALALGRKFSASRFWDEIRAADASAFCYIGELCRYLLNQPPGPRDSEHRVRVIVGNGLRPDLWTRFQERFGIAHICEFYGASESTLAFVNAFNMPRTAGYCPLPFAIVEFDAAAEVPRRNARGRLCKVKKGGIGLLITEVAERTPFDGYVNRSAGSTDASADEKAAARSTRKARPGKAVAGRDAPQDRKANEAKLLREVFKRGDCWFNTGDLVRDQGWRHIQFVDRVGDTFRWRGENVATTEVEAALNGFAGIEDAVVYGVTVPDAEGRAGMAALSWHGKTADFDGAGLARHLREKLPAYAVPLFLRLRAAQELTGTFKHRKVELKQAGFDPARIDEPLFVLLDAQRGYEALGAELFARIGRGELRL